MMQLWLPHQWNSNEVIDSLMISQKINIDDEYIHTYCGINNNELK